METLWSIQLLGRLRLTCGDRLIDRFRTQKAAGILAYLAYHLHRSHSREFLIDLVWPEAEIDSARHSLSLALSSLRSQLEPPGSQPGSVIVADRFTVELNPKAVSTDVERFEQSLRDAAIEPEDQARARRFEEAMELYRGPLLPGFYDEWIGAEQTRLADRFVHAALQLASIRSKNGDTGLALDLTRRALTLEPLREDLNAQIMRMYIAAGQPAAASSLFRDFEQALLSELGARPGAAIQHVARQAEELAASSPRPQFTLPIAHVSAPAGAAAPPALCPSKPDLPGGTVTFLMTDIEGSTARWEREGPEFRSVLRLHHAVLRREFQRHAGREVKEAGDSFLVAFAAASDALACAVSAQRAIRAQQWPQSCEEPRVRMALHSGDVEIEEGEYRGLSLHRASRILSAAHGGQILCSEALYGLLRRDLESEVRLRDLGVFRLRDVEIPERLFEVEARTQERTQERFPPVRAERAVQTNLPAQVTRFFGRERELSRLKEILEPNSEGGSHVRLVTLTGPGGTGKTRLALEAARRLVDAYSGALWLVALADVSVSELVPEVVLSAIGGGFSDRVDRTASQLIVEALRQKPSLLVLDNLEHLMRSADEECPVADFVQELMEKAPDLKIVATSRQLLRVEGELEISVGPLDTPSRVENCKRGTADAADTVDAESLSMFDSVRLFIDRAQAVKPDMEVSARNAPAIAEICSRLEGIPLAIELAAARAMVLTPTQMLQHLSLGAEGRFELLVTRKRGIAERQKALRNTIEWSFRLLSPELQELFCRLAVFRGGWTVEAAEAIVEGVGLRLAYPLLDSLAQLRECSLVTTEEAPQGIRFRMLETLREYALSQMGTEALDHGKCRHAVYFAEFSETAAHELRREQQGRWLEQLEAEHDNMRAALAWAREDDHEVMLRLCSALWYFWSIRGHLAEGRRNLSGALNVVGSDHPEWGKSVLRAKVLSGAGALAHDQSDYGNAAVYLEDSVRLWRALPTDAQDRQSGLAQAILYLANVRLDQGELEKALIFYQEALDLYRQVSDTRGEAMALSNLGVLHLEQGDADRAAEHLSSSIALKRKLGNPYGLAMSLESLGNLERSRGNLEIALEHCRETLIIRQRLGHQMGIAMSLNNMGHILLETGDTDGAAIRLRESLDLFLDMDEPRGAIESLTGLAGVAAARGNHELAARLMGAMEAERERSGFELRPCEKMVIKRWKGAVRGVLGDQLDAVWQRGRRTDWEEALRLA